jgi:folate-binding protein YgfZ
MTPPPGDPRAELAAARDGTIVADLSHNALLSISGDDATAFLHGQFTNDVEALREGEAQWNGWCSAKGRLLATFLLLKSSGGYLLMLPAEIAPAIARRLGMFVLRSKVKIADATAHWRLFGLAGKAARPAVGSIFDEVPAPMRSVSRAGAVCVAIGEERFAVFVPAAEAEALLVRLEQSAMRAGPEAWEWTNVRAGVPVIVAATQEAFVPQMANFDLVGGVSFRKGCYPGQEIVARTQYRGILKRRMARAYLPSEGAARPGDSVFSSLFGEQAAGTVVQAVRSPEGGYDLLVVAQLESLEKNDLRFGAPDGQPIQVREVPRLPTS